MAATVSIQRQNPNARGEGRVRVLAAAFEEAERLPALSDSRDRALERLSRGAPPHGKLGALDRARPC